MGKSPKFKQEHPLSSGLYFVLSHIPAEILVLLIGGLLWLIGGFLLFVVGPVTISLLSDNTAIILPSLIGLIFLAGVVLPVVMVVISWRKDQNRRTDIGKRGR